MSPAPACQLLIERLTDRYTRLLETLEVERQALLERAPDTLEAVVPAKETLCQEIMRDQQLLLDALADVEKEPAGIAALRELARHCREENAVNGRIVHRARQTNRALLGLLTGEPVSGLYDPAGQPLASAHPAGGHHLGCA